MDIIPYIPSGRDNAIDRKLLSRVSGMSDRVMRACIEDTRIKAESLDKVVCNPQNGDGYYLADDIEDVVRQFKRTRSRVNSQLLQLENMKRILEEGGRHVE